MSGRSWVARGALSSLSAMGLPGPQCPHLQNGVASEDGLGDLEAPLPRPEPVADVSVHHTTSAQCLHLKSLFWWNFRLPLSLY